MPGLARLNLGRRERLYRVQLHQADTWPGYRGQRGDTCELEIFEHWLEPAGEGAT